MPYVAVPDHLAGDVFTLANWQTHIEGNLNAGVMRPLADIVLSANATTINFVSIPATFAHLKLVCNLRTDRAAVTDALLMRINNISTASYHNQYLYAGGTAVTAVEALAATSVIGPNLPGASATAGRFGSVEITIPYYAQTGDKYVGHWIGANPYSTTTGTIIQNFGAFGYDIATGAINQLTLLPQFGTNFVSGSRVTLYGLPLI